MRRVHEYVVLANRRLRHTVQLDPRLHQGLLELAERARTPPTPMTDEPILQERECPFCGGIHRAEFAEDVEEMVMACREKYPSNRGDLDSWASKMEGTFPVILTTEMEVMGKRWQEYA